MATGEEAIELVLKMLFECEAKGIEIDMQDLRETTEKFIKENGATELVAQIINEAINQLEDLRKMEDEKKMKDFHKFSALLKLATIKEKNVIFKSFKSNAIGLMVDEKIGLSDKLDLKEATKTLAHELAHTYLHYDKGNTIASDNHEEYEEQANRVMELIIDLLDVI